MEAKDRKRPRGEADDQSKSKSQPPPPSYGSQEYWEERYRKLQKVQAGQEPDPFHAWYFSYEDLAPLLLPLVLGEDDDEVGEKGKTQEESEDEDASKEGDEEGKKAEDDQQYEDKSEEGGGNGSESQDEGEEEGDEEIDDESEAGEEEVTRRRVGLVKNGPISIIEIGCGDVPLGRDLAHGVKELEPETGIKTEQILKKVVCTDYSETVIKAMKEEQSQKEGTDDKDMNNKIPLVYEVADARKLPYADNSFEMVIEKGTLDAMLSDKELGSSNCILIIAECARILSIGGEIKCSERAGMLWFGFRYHLTILCSYRFDGNCIAFECSH
jgi:hypothetical protein